MTMRWPVNSGSGRRTPLMPMAAAILAAGVVLSGCGASGEVDPRCSIDASIRHREKIAKFVNGSKLWRAYFNHLQPTKEGAKPLVAFTFETERRTKRTYGSGDYDPGTVTITFNVKSLQTRHTLFTKEVSVALDSFMIGAFDANATRAEIQEVAFRATEEEVYPFLDHWVDVAALEAMTEVDSGASAFRPVLEKLVSDEWAGKELRVAAKRILQEL